MLQLKKAVFTTLLGAVLLLPQGFIYAYDPSITATMTSNTAPSGYVVDGSCARTDTNATTDAWMIFDGLTAHPHDLYTDTRGVPKCSIQLPAAKVLTAWGYFCDSTWTGECPTEMTIWGSNDGSSWTVIDDHTGLSDPAGSSEVDFTVSNTTAYTYYGFQPITSNAGYGRAAFGELYLYGTSGGGGGGGGTTTASSTLGWLWGNAPAIPPAQADIIKDNQSYILAFAVSTFIFFVAFWVTLKS